MDTADKVVAGLYNFHTFDFESKVKFYGEIKNFIDSNGARSLKWPRLRCENILILLEKIIGLQEDEKTLNKIEESFTQIKDIYEIDLCLMFWQITKDQKYLDYIRSVAQRPNCFLSSAAQIIIDLNQ